ncbi:hypothetical protein GA0070604_5435 [Micromonospora eburnea]|uniref:Uncharacterized protein n=2 Tax=Micromonospora eburnea TaxID=227316 RepID=A0A1C6VGH3_9ACTN|nr:hypothetical protein GA0070604_5435 [Micromonospora eburnea]
MRSGAFRLFQPSVVRFFLVALFGEDGVMSAWNRWWGRLGAVLGGIVLSVFVPVAAWASTGTGELVVEAARRRRGGFGFLGLFCCLVVVGVVVLLVLLLMRLTRRRSGPPR